MEKVEDVKINKGSLLVLSEMQTKKDKVYFYCDKDNLSVLVYVSDDTINKHFEIVDENTIRAKDDIEMRLKIKDKDKILENLNISKAYIGYKDGIKVIKSRYI